MQPEFATCEVPDGDYLIGDERWPESRPEHRLSLKGFRIGAGAVSCAQFAGFIKDGAYQQSAYWTDMGWRWQLSKQEQHPAFWQDVRFNHPEQPVVGVSWYEAAAYASWLAEKTGIPWRLPSEAEWEAAARTPPWHNILNPDMLINTAEMGIGRPWPVLQSGQASWCGAFHMLGNVWEWTASKWGRNWQTLEYHYPFDPQDGREVLQGSAARVMRGGSWFDTHRLAHPAHRARYLPGSRGSNIGFRLVYSI